MPNKIELILCTCPYRETAEKIARYLVEGRLSACINILPGVTSVYSWKGHLETAEEHLLLIKSNSDRYAYVEHAIRDLHPYELPEIISLPVERGFSDYLSWIDSCVSIN
jgi:periplasmic divalent cation tolerance protein